MLDHAKRVQFLEEMGAPADALAMAHMVSWHHTRQKRALAGESYLRFCLTAQTTQPQGSALLLPEIEQMLGLDGSLPEGLRLVPLEQAPNSKVSAPTSIAEPAEPWLVEAQTPVITSCVSFKKALEIADHPRRWGEATPQMTIIDCHSLPSNGAIWRQRMTKRTDFGTPLITSMTVLETIEITADGFDDPEDNSGFRRYSYVMRSTDPTGSSLVVLEESGWIELSGNADGSQLRIHKRAVIASLPDGGLRAVMSAALSAEVWMWATAFFIASGQKIYPPKAPEQPPRPGFQVKPAPPAKCRVAVLGGGPAGLACAWLLSNPRNSKGKPAWTSSSGLSIKVELFEQSWRPGGKTASARRTDTEKARIEEHGLHVVMGCYGNLIKMLRWSSHFGGLDLLSDTSRLRIPIDRSRDPAHAWTPTFKAWRRRKRGDRLSLTKFLLAFFEAWRLYFDSLVRSASRQPFLSLPPLILDPAMKVMWQAVNFVRRLHGPSKRPRPLMRALLAMAQHISSKSPENGVLRNSSDFLLASMHWTARLGLGAELHTGSLVALRRSNDDREDNSPFEQLGTLARLLRAIGRTALQPNKGTDADRFAAEMIELGTTIIAGLDDLGFFPAWAVDDTANLGSEQYSNWVRNLQTLDTQTLAGWLHDNGISKGFVKGSRLLDAVTSGLFTTPDNIGAGTFINGFARLVLAYDEAPCKRMKGGTGEAIVAPLMRALLDTKNVDAYFDATVQGIDIDPKTHLATTVSITQPTGNAPCMTVPLASDGHYGWSTPPTPNLQPVVKSSVPADYFVLAIPPFQKPMQGLPANLATRLSRIGSCATLGLQHWSGGDPRYPGVILSGLPEPLRCAASMEQLKGSEGPGYKHAPVYYCGAISDDETPKWNVDYAKGWLKANASLYQKEGSEIHEPFLSPNFSCSERYALSDPDSLVARPYCYESEVPNLFMAGDWTRTALNCGSIEAAVTSGLEAARSILDNLECDLNFSLVGSLLYPPNPGR